MNHRSTLKPPHHIYYSVSASTAITNNNATKPPPPYIEFPTSPQSQSADAEPVMIQHYTHPNHPLAQITVPADLFLCGGCKEYGAGKRFTCQLCNFQLHEFCALSPPLLRSHALHPQHQLVFHSRPKQAGLSWPKCDVCGKSIKGFTFRCRACSFQMHPCCAMLSTEMIFPPPQEQEGLLGNAAAHRHSLKLLPSSSGSQLLTGNTTSTTTSNSGGNNNTTGTAAVCGECKKKRAGGRIYGCTACNYHLHALCAKATINGLRADGITAPEKPNKTLMLGTAARLASQVVIEFIGGLIEGFGDGVGQALADNIGGGDRRIRRRSTPPS